MLVEGYDYPPADDCIECEKCGGTGKNYYVARGLEGEEQIRRVSESEYERAEDIPDYDHPEVWCKYDITDCAFCNGEGWINPREEEEIAKEIEAEARETERKIERYLASLT